MFYRIFKAITGGNVNDEQSRLSKGRDAARTPGTLAFTVNMRVQLLGGYVDDTEKRLRQSGLPDAEKTLLQADLAFYREHFAALSKELAELETDPQAAWSADIGDIGLPRGRPSSLMTWGDAVFADSAVLRRKAGAKLGNLGHVEIAVGPHPLQADINMLTVLSPTAASYSGVEGRLRRLFG